MDSNNEIIETSPGVFQQKDKNDKYHVVRKHGAVYTIPERAILDLVSGRAKIINIPKGAAYVAVGEDFYSRSWHVFVTHSSLPLIEEGTSAMIIPTDVEFLNG